MGEDGQGNQLNHPKSIYVDDNNQCIYIVDSENDRIVQWKFDTKVSEVVAGGNERGNRMDQLSQPTDVVMDKKTDSLIICDQGNRRVMRWPRRNGTNGRIIISNIDCWGLAMDNNGELYVSDFQKHEVRRWKIGETTGTIVAGGKREGNQPNQLNLPTYLFVDEDQSVYVSDCMNNRVMKWVKGAKQGIVVAGGSTQGDSLAQLHYPYGVVVDHLGSVYVADCSNHRIVCWSKGSRQGRLIVGGSQSGPRSNQFSNPYGLSFDGQGHLYVSDFGNHRVQKFEIELN